jgi:predicted ester cyclase
VTRGRNRDLAGPALVLAGAGAVAGAVAGGAVARRRRLAARTPAALAPTIARRLLEEPWTGRLETIDELVAPDYVGHDPAEEAPVLGPEGVHAWIDRYRSAFADARLTVDEQVVEGDRVVSRWTLRGAHSGSLAGIEPTAKEVTVSGVTISRIANGKIVETWSSWDRLGLLVQLGAVAEPAHA